MTKIKKKFNIYVSLHEDSISGYVWINDDSINNGFYRIKNIDKKKRINVYLRKIDPNWLRRYNENKNTKNIDASKDNIVISKYYRDLLGIESRIVNLEIKETCRLRKYFLPNFYHPNPFIGPNIVLAISLGVISLFLGIRSCCSTKEYRNQLDQNIELLTNNVKNETKEIRTSIREMNNILIQSHYILDSSNDKSLKREISDLDSILITNEDKIDQELYKSLNSSTRRILVKVNLIESKILEIRKINNSLDLRERQN